MILFTCVRLTSMIRCTGAQLCWMNHFTGAQIHCTDVPHILMVQRTGEAPWMIRSLGEAGLCWIGGSGVQVLALASLLFDEHWRCEAAWDCGRNRSAMRAFVCCPSTLCIRG